MIRALEVLLAAVLKCGEMSARSRSGVISIIIMVTHGIGFKRQVTLKTEARRLVPITKVERPQQRA